MKKTIIFELILDDAGIIKLDEDAQRGETLLDDLLWSACADFFGTGDNFRLKRGD